MKKYIATVISRIFDPLVVITVIMLLAFLRSGLPPIVGIKLFVAVYTIGVLIPVVLLLFAIRRKIIDSWDIPKRHMRLVPLGIEFVATLIGYGIVLRFGNAFLVQLFILLLLWLAGFFCITALWKISGHVGTVALATGLLLRWFGWGAWPVLFIVPLVGWARVVRRDHTVAQVIAGAAYSWILILLHETW